MLFSLDMIVSQENWETPPVLHGYASGGISDWSVEPNEALFSYHFIELEDIALAKPLSL